MPSISFAQRKTRAARSLWMGLLGVVACSCASADGITILSQDLRIDGHWGETWYTFDDACHHHSNGAFSHLASDGNGISSSVSSGPYGWVQAVTFVDGFNLRLDGHAAPFGLSYDWGEGSLGGTGIWLEASATTRFRVQSQTLSLTLNGWSMFNYYADEQDLVWTLRDVTQSSVLWSLTASSGWDSWGWTTAAEIACAFDVDPAHEFELFVSGWAFVWDAKNVSLGSSIGLTSARVPDAARTAMLLGFGFLFIIAAVAATRSPSPARPNARRTAPRALE
jgi:hypothetical protein